MRGPDSAGLRPGDTIAVTDENAKVLTATDSRYTLTCWELGSAGPGLQRDLQARSLGLHRARRRNATIGPPAPGLGKLSQHLPDRYCPLS